MSGITTTTGDAMLPRTGITPTAANCQFTQARTGGRGICLGLSLPVCLSALLKSIPRLGREQSPFRAHNWFCRLGRRRRRTASAGDNLRLHPEYRRRTCVPKPIHCGESDQLWGRRFQRHRRVLRRKNFRLPLSFLGLRLENPNPGFRPVRRGPIDAQTTALRVSYA